MNLVDNEDYIVVDVDQAVANSRDEVPNGSFHAFSVKSLEEKLENILWLPISALLHKYFTVFEEPKGLPSFRGHEYRIHLFPNVVPFNVTPYRYPRFQKDTRERIVSEMLDFGII